MIFSWSNTKRVIVYALYVIASAALVHAVLAVPADVAPISTWYYTATLLFCSRLLSDMFDLVLLIYFSLKYFDIEPERGSRYHLLLQEHQIVSKHINDFVHNCYCIVLLDSASCIIDDLRDLWNNMLLTHELLRAFALCTLLPISLFVLLCTFLILLDLFFWTSVVDRVLIFLSFAYAYGDYLSDEPNPRWPGWASSKKKCKQVAILISLAVIIFFALLIFI